MHRSAWITSFGLETFIYDAERAGDHELAEFFRKAQADSRKGAEQGKTLLKFPARLATRWVSNCRHLAPLFDQGIYGLLERAGLGG